MKILLTNDDSIRPNCLAALWSALKDIADVVVVAPDRSGVLQGMGLLWMCLCGLENTSLLMMDG